MEVHGKTSAESDLWEELNDLREDWHRKLRAEGSFKPRTIEVIIASSCIQYAYATMSTKLSGCEEAKYIDEKSFLEFCSKVISKTQRKGVN